MKLTRCMHKHYYDGSKHSVCPQCIAKGFITYPEITNATTKESTSSDSGIAKDTPSYSNIANEYPLHSIQPIEALSVASNKDSDPDTSDFIGSFWGIKGAEEPSPSENKDIEKRPSSYNSEKKTLEPHDSIHSNQPAISQQEPHHVSELSLQNEVAKARSLNTNSFENPKMSACFSNMSDKPVVGWLIALNGIYRGKSFSLKAGNNTIGRWAQMDIVLTQEPTVSRDRHSIITYESGNRSFFVLPGESNGLTYLNGTVLFSPSSLSDGDIIELGDCKLLFKALCGASFSWDDLI